MLHKADKIFVVILVVFGIVQLHLFQRVQVHLYPKGFTTENFEKLVKNLALHNTYSDGEYPDLEPYTFRPPFHPLMLSLCYRGFGNYPHSGIVFHNLLLFFTIVIIYFTGRLLHPFVGLFAAVIACIDPICIVRANSTQSEIPFMLMLSISLFFLVTFLKDTENLIAAALFSLFLVVATFTRIVTLYFPVLVPFVIFFGFHRILKEDWRKYLKFLAILAVVFYLPVGFWMHRNYVASGNVDFAGEVATGLFSFVASQAKGDREGVSRAEARKALVEKYLNNADYLRLRCGEKEKYEINIAKKIIFEYWPESLKHYLKGFPVLFFGYPVRLFSLNYSPKNYERFKEIILRGSPGIATKIRKLRLLLAKGYWDYVLYSIFIGGYYLLNLILSMIGFYLMIFKAKKIEERRIGMFLFCLFGYIVFITCIWATGRLRTQIVPIMSFSSSFSLYYLFSNRTRFLRGLKTFRGKQL